MKSTGFILILSSLLLVGCGNDSSSSEANVEKTQAEAEVAQDNLATAQTEEELAIAEAQAAKAAAEAAQQAAEQKQATLLAAQTEAERKRLEAERKIAEEKAAKAAAEAEAAEKKRQEAEAKRIAAEAEQERAAAALKAAQDEQNRLAAEREIRERQQAEQERAAADQNQEFVGPPRNDIAGPTQPTTPAPDNSDGTPALLPTITAACNAEISSEKTALIERCKNSGASFEKVRTCQNYMEIPIAIPIVERIFAVCLETKKSQIDACEKVVSGATDLTKCLDIVTKSDLTYREIVDCDSWWDSDTLACIKRKK